MKFNIGSGNTYTLTNVVALESASSNASLEIITGQVLTPAFQAGGNSGNYGDLKVVGTTAILTSTGPNNYLGFSGTGRLTLSDGATATFGNTYLGTTATGFGQANIGLAGANTSTLNATGLLAVGNGGMGLFDVGAKGVVNVAQNLDIASTAGSTGSVTVNGALNVTGGMYIGGRQSGAGGTGTLNLSAGGTINTGSLTRYTGGTFNHTGGTLQINGGAFNLGDSSSWFLQGANTPELRLNGAGANFADGATRSLAVGATMSGRLVVSGGATPELFNLFLGESAGATGHLTVDGPGSVLTLRANGVVGINQAGTANVTLSNGGRLAMPAISLGIGASPTASSTVTVGGTGSALDVGGTLTLSHGSTVNVDVGGTTNVGGLSVVTATSVVHVSGGSLNVTNDINLNAGTVNLSSGTINTRNLTRAVAAGFNHTGGTLVINGGTLNLNATQIGISGAGYAQVVLNGAGANVANGASTYAFVGTAAGAAGDLLIVGGATPTLSGLSLANASGSTGTLTVDGAGSALTLSNVFYGVIGGAGNASATVQNGGRLSVPNAGLLIAADPGSTASLAVQGTNSAVTLGGQLEVGGNGVRGGTGTVNINTGGSVSATVASIYAGSVINLNGGSLGLTANSIMNNGVFRISTGSYGVPFQMAGTGSFVHDSTGTTTLTNAGNTYSGGTTINRGTVAIASDGALGTGPVNVSAFGTLRYTANTTSVGRTFNLNGGTLRTESGAALGLLNAAVGGGFLNGEFSTGLGGGTLFAGVTLNASTFLFLNGSSDTLRNVVNQGHVRGGSVAGGTTVRFDAVTNGSGGRIYLPSGTTAATAIHASDFVSNGLLTIEDGPSPSLYNVFANTGTSELNFGGGSRTFISTPQQAALGTGQIKAYLDLNGRNAIVAGGLFVNNGGVYSSAGSSQVIADFGALVKGAGYWAIAPATRNGGQYLAGNSPGKATAGSATISGPAGGQTSSIIFQINNATGTAGPSADAQSQVSGWSILNVQRVTSGPVPLQSSGNLVWSATASDKLTINLQTLLNPTTVGTDVPGLMSNFDSSRYYEWVFISQVNGTSPGGPLGTYSGPTDDATLTASVNFLTTSFLNDLNGGRFGIHYVDNSQATIASRDFFITFTPIPEPGMLAGGALVFGAVLVRRPNIGRRRRR